MSNLYWDNCTSVHKWYLGTQYGKYQIPTYTRTAVRVAGDPGAVHGKHHEEQEDNKHDNHAQVHPKIIALTLKY